MSKRRVPPQGPRPTAHELRTPLTALMTASDLLGDGRPAEIVRSRTRALSHLVEELLELARVEARSEPFDAEPIDVPELVRRVAQACDVPVAIEAAEPSTITTDRRHLERILTNVLLNAARHGAAPIASACRSRSPTPRRLAPICSCATTAARSSPSISGRAGSGPQRAANEPWHRAAGRAAGRAGPRISRSRAVVSPCP